MTETKQFDVFDADNTSTNSAILTDVTVNEYGYRIVNCRNNFSDKLFFLDGDNKKIFQLTDEESINFIREKKLKSML